MFPIRAQIAQPDSFVGGTVLLEGIENLDIKIQGKLLRFLKSQKSRIRESENSPSDIRVIASCFPDIAEKVSQGTFMQELFYALRVISIHLPPLKERRSDIPLLAEYFLRKYCRQNNKVISHISPEATKILMSYQWPGNVEELENNIYSAVVMCQGEQILPEHLHDEILENLRSQDPSIQLGGNHETLPEAVRKLEKHKIERALKESGGNQSLAAKRLGIHEATLRKKIKKLGINSGKRRRT